MLSHWARLAKTSTFNIQTLTVAVSPKDYVVVIAASFVAAGWGDVVDQFQNFLYLFGTLRMHFHRRNNATLSQLISAQCSLFAFVSATSHFSTLRLVADISTSVQRNFGLHRTPVWQIKMLIPARLPDLYSSTNLMHLYFRYLRILYFEDFVLQI